MSRLIIFDFEVFKYDSLLGAVVIDNDRVDIAQLWIENHNVNTFHEITDFYEQHVADIWIGHNNERYDNMIMQAIIRKTDPYVMSKDIIERDMKKWLNVKLDYYDLMSQHFVSLKTMEAYMGKNISESKIDFNIDRPLTAEEKAEVEKYNRDDLDQTVDDFYYMKHEFALRLDVIKEFKLPMRCLHITGTSLAEEVLHAEKIHGIENWVVKPTLYPQLKIKNQAVLDFYLNEDFRKGKNLFVNLCGTEHKLGAGGIHAAKKKYHVKKALYFDVSGYYNLVMLNYNLLPRSIPDEYKKLYEFMYHEQLRLKKIDPGKRGVYKTILLSVFGAMMNEHCRFYDPYNGLLVTITGQIFLVDLLEKLEGKVENVQSNTDGIVVVPLPGVSDEEVKEIVDEWQQRTGFSLKIETVYDLHQRDVNCYMYRDASGEIHTLGEAVKDYGKWEWPFWKESYNSKEPIIISTGIVEYFMNGVLPEETVAKNAKTLRMFQYIAKKLSFDWLEYEETDLETGQSTLTTVQAVNRAFALKSNKVRGMLYKRKHSGKVTKSKVPNLPDSVFIYDDEILSDEAVQKLADKIDYQYYVDRIYERILEFVSLKKVNNIL